MNILLIHSHDTGRYIQPYGYAVETPNLMKLANEGILLRNAFCTGPTCSPSRAAMLTGMYPHSCGMLGLAHRGFKIDDYEKHIANFLNNKGYETVLCGIQHEAPEAKMIGYSKILDEQDYNMGKQNPDWAEWDMANAERVAAYLKTVSKDKPLFLSYGIFNPHRVFQKIDDDINPDYVLPPHGITNTPENRKDTAAFMTSVRVMDKCVGIVLQGLKESGLSEDTVVIYTTDHGPSFPKMKCTLFDDGIGVAFIVRYPQVIREAKTVDSIISHVDLFPTLCDILKIDKPTWLEGKSFYKILTGERDKTRDYIYSEVSFHVAYEPLRCIRSERYKYIKFYDDYDQYVLSNIDDSPEKELMVNNGFISDSREKEMLFDLYLDPEERVNRINDMRYSEIKNDLLARMNKWMTDTNDPLVKGRIIPPKGALVNALDTISTSEKRYINYY